MLLNTVKTARSKADCKSTVINKSVLAHFSVFLQVHVLCSRTTQPGYPFIGRCSEYLWRLWSKQTHCLTHWVYQEQWQAAVWLLQTIRAWGRWENINPWPHQEEFSSSLQVPHNQVKTVEQNKRPKGWCQLIVICVSDSGLGCTIKRYCMSIFIYMDDIILVAPSVSALQRLCMSVKIS